jgi:hypothetical protein
MMSMEQLISTIEMKREELNHAGSKLPLTDGRVIALSEELDVLLNSFEVMRNEFPEEG